MSCPCTTCSLNFRCCALLLVTILLHPCRRYTAGEPKNLPDLYFGPNGVNLGGLLVGLKVLIDVLDRAAGIQAVSHAATCSTAVAHV
jgi:hypothetical protein